MWLTNLKGKNRIRLFKKKSIESKRRYTILYILLPFPYFRFVAQCLFYLQLVLRSEKLVRITFCCNQVTSSKMHTDDRIGHLLIIASTLFASIVFAIISVASDGWDNRISQSLLNYYNSTGQLLCKYSLSQSFLPQVRTFCVTFIHISSVDRRMRGSHNSRHNLPQHRGNYSLCEVF